MLELQGMEAVVTLMPEFEMGAWNASLFYNLKSGIRVQCLGYCYASIGLLIVF